MATQTAAAAAAAKVKVVAAKQQRICDVWATRMSIVYKDARKVSPPQVAAALKGLKWEAEYQILGKNTHVSIT